MKRALLATAVGLVGCSPYDGEHAVWRDSSCRIDAAPTLVVGGINRTWPGCIVIVTSEFSVGQVILQLWHAPSSKPEKFVVNVSPAVVGPMLHVTTAEDVTGDEVAVGLFAEKIDNSVSRYEAKNGLVTLNRFEMARDASSEWFDIELAFDALALTNTEIATVQIPVSGVLHLSGRQPASE